MNGKQDSDEFMQDNSIETTKLQQEALDILIETAPKSFKQSLNSNDLVMTP